MCGICGVFGEINEPLLHKMLQSIAHRGPDDEGIHIDKNVMLGNRRLSIIDLATGKQPIYNEDRSLCIVYNGEIYNFRDLRQELLKKGHKFTTNSDTEVIIHSYEEWGETCPNKFNGMFAFAIWDSNNNWLYLARDRFGIKPFYYHWSNRKKKFIFASEIKAILQDQSIERIPNAKRIFEYLMYDRHDHDDNTFFQNIKSILPANYAIVDKNGIKLKKYWSLEVNRNLEFPKFNKEHSKKFYELLEDSIRLRLISEVPIGTSFSGGLDSSSIVCIVNRLIRSGLTNKKLIGDRQKTFSLVFEDRKIDERKYITAVLRKTDAERNFTTPTSKECWDALKNFVYHQDEPCGGLTVFGQWSVMKLASKKVTVLLDGQGGDELLAGYDYYYLDYFRDLWRTKKVFRLLAESIMALDFIIPLIKMSLSQRNTKAQIQNILNPEFCKKYESIVNQEVAQHPTMLADRLYLSVIKNHIPQLLRYEDRNSMAFSIEARVPFLDYRLVEYVFSLPVSYKIRNGWTKFILRDAMTGILPDEVRLRRKKLGYAVPDAKWLKELQDAIRKVFKSEKFKNNLSIYMDTEELNSKFDEFCDGKLDDCFSSIFWRALNLELWFELFIEQK